MTPESNAVLSQCGKYRYSLTRIWDADLPRVMFMMLNPSTADANNDDPTIRRCINFAKSWGYGGLYVCNLMAYRSTDPKELVKADNPFGIENALHIEKLAEKVEVIICAWGNTPILKKLFGHYKPTQFLMSAESKLYYLELSNDGTPKHPLYLKSDLMPLKLEALR